MLDKETLIRGYQSGRLLETIEGELSTDGAERTELASVLAALHNDGSIDLLAAFGGLQREGDNGPDFFSLRHVFEESVPNLKSPVLDVMRTVLHLYQEAGNDLAAGTILTAIRDFFSRSPELPQAALAEIEANSEELADLLVTTLVAGSAGDRSLFVSETIRLCRSASTKVRKRALYALGRLEGRPNVVGNDEIVHTLELAVASEGEGEILASTLSSAFELSRQPSADQPRLLHIMAEALAKGGDIVLHAAAQIFGFRTGELWPELLELFLDHLAKVPPANLGTLEKVDYGIANLLRNGSEEAGLSILEKLLRSEPKNLDLSMFDHAARTIRETPALRDKVVTRWSLEGEPALCATFEALVNPRTDDATELAADVAELGEAEAVRFLFAARKVIGYLFLQPTSAASFVLSLMRRVPDDTVRRKLGGLLLNPLLMNFTGSLSEYLGRRAEAEPDEIRTQVEEVVKALDKYLAALKSVGDVPALHPSLEHRHAHHRHFSGEVAKSFEQAQEQSTLLQLMHRSTVLYGRKAVHHISGPEGEVSRMETHLGAHGTNIDVPRMTILDPRGLDHMLHVFRLERLSR